MSISGCWWKEIKGFNNVMLNNTNKGNLESEKREEVQVYTHPAPNSKPEPLGTAIAIARNMPTIDEVKKMDEGQRNKMIADFIKKNGVTECKPGESGNGNKELSAWARISFDKDTHPLDRQEKEGRGHKKKKAKKKVNKRKRASSN